MHSCSIGSWFGKSIQVIVNPNVIHLVKLINAMKITSDWSKVIFNGFKVGF
jgi:hypothetical protein